MHSELSNFGLFLVAIAKALLLTGIGPGIALAIAYEALCPICHKPESEFCAHDLAYLESVAQLWANHQRWREETHAEQAAQMARLRSSGGGQLATALSSGSIPSRSNRATSPPRKVRRRA
jgi:hypothetical protein